MTMFFAAASRTFSARVAPRAVANLGGLRGMASLKKKDPNSFKDVYLSESGVYPIIVVLGFAGCLASYVIATGLAYNPDVRISKKNRSAIIRE